LKILLAEHTSKTNDILFNFSYIELNEVTYSLIAVVNVDDTESELNTEWEAFIQK